MGTNRFAFMLCAMIACLRSFAVEPSISVTATPRYPWSGMVDIDFTITGDSGEKYDTSFTAKDLVGGTNLAMKTVLDANGVTLSLTNSLAPGSYRWMWNAAADLPDGFVCERVKVDGRSETPLGGVQLWEGGPYWAECNVGAAKPEEYGYYFWWGDTVGCKRNSGNNGWVSVKDGAAFSFSYGSCPTVGKDTDALKAAGYIDSTGNLVSAHDAATAHLGAPWRMPTLAECNALRTNCTITWMTLNGVVGMFLSGKGAYASRGIFLPYAGCGDGSVCGNIGIDGYCWSSTSYSINSDLAWSIHVYSWGGCVIWYFSRCLGLSVRPVREFVK